jgi:aspartate-semialdehyde dehydrogenase
MVEARTGQGSTTSRLPSEPAVAVVGATGLVGEVLIALLEERKFPVSRLIPCAGRSAGAARVRFRGEELPVSVATLESLARAELIFFAATGELSRDLAPELARRGATVVDKSSTWRLAPEVPLVVPEINARQLLGGARLVACPNCTTIGLVMALEPLRRAAGLARVQVTTFQSASGAGRAGLERLQAETAARDPAPDPASPFPGVLAGNVLPQCDALGADGETSEERKLRDETRKILALPELEVSATCVRVPVPVGHAAAVWVETVEPLSVGEARRVLGAFPGVRVVDLPTPAEAAGRDDVLVGRIRSLPGRRGVQLFQASDNLRKGAATNALQIAEFLLAQA